MLLMACLLLQHAACGCGSRQGAAVRVGGSRMYGAPLVPQCVWLFLL